MVHKLVNFIYDCGDNWIEEIQKEPYCIKVVQDEDFILLRYNQLNSDMSLSICQVCRGLILQKLSDGDLYLACYPFNKFFNYGECFAAAIDWSTATVHEKVDGSLIKFWTDFDGNWHVSTNGTIDAFKATIDSFENTTFGQVVEKALGCNYKLFCENLDENYTYMFELVSPETQVTIPYNEYTLYYLGQRNKHLFTEEYKYEEDWVGFGIKEPKRYELSSLKDCIAVVNEFSKDEEGVVVCDANFNRIKIKSPEYLIAARAANNGALGMNTAIRLIKEDKVDDFIAYAPMHEQKLLKIRSHYSNIIRDLEHSYSLFKEDAWQTRKNFVQLLKRHNIKGQEFAYCMWRYTNRDEEPKKYLEILPEKTLIKLIKEREEYINE